MSTAPETASAPKLRRALTLWDLILYGIIVLQPTAPMSVYGVLGNRGRGHVVTTILIAMVAMLFTAISYGRMARAYPSAGSAFTYVGQEINPALGYVTGWSMVMDYMLNPIICTIWCSQQAHVFAPAIPYWGWAIFFAGVFTFLNVQGVKTSARVNTALATGMGVVVAIFFVAAARYLLGAPHEGAGFFTRPFYDPQLFNTNAVLGATSVAVLTYIGFDGISTLSEEAENPRRNILLDSPHLPGDRYSFGNGSLCRSTGVAGIPAIPECGYGIHLCSGPCLAAFICPGGLYADCGQFRFRDGSPTRRGSSAVRNGEKQRASQSLLWSCGSQTP